MSTLQIALSVTMVVMLLAGLWLRRRAGQAGGGKKPAERIDTVTGWPPTATRALGKAELRTLGTLVQALPEYLVFAQVPLSRFISVPKRNSYADWLRRIGYQCVDFMVCDMSAHVVAVVELAPLQPSDRSRKRLDRIARTLKAAQIPFHVWRDTGLPSVAEVREALLPGMPALPATMPTPRPAPAAAPVAVAAGAATAATAAIAATETSAPSGGNPFEDTSRDATQDETIELLEPPPSTWFDDMDSDPIPLSKR